MTRKFDTGRDPSRQALREADRIAGLHPEQQRGHPTAVAADPDKLRHAGACVPLPEYYIDKPFICRRCGKREIWRARDQKWYYEEAKGSLEATAVECHRCRTAGRDDGKSG